MKHLLDTEFNKQGSDDTLLSHWWTEAAQDRRNLRYMRKFAEQWPDFSSATGCCTNTLAEQHRLSQKRHLCSGVAEGGGQLPQQVREGHPGIQRPARRANPR